MRKSSVSVTVKKPSGLILGPKSESKSTKVRIYFFGSTMSWNQPEKLHVQVQFYNLSQIIGVWTSPLQGLRVRLGNVNLAWLWRWCACTQLVRRWLLRHLTFYRLHAAYFMVLACVGAGLLWLCRRRERVGGSDGSPKLLDCVFAAVSALTVTGLLTVRVRDFSTLGMLVLLILMVLGSHVFTSLLPLYVRRFHFSRISSHDFGPGLIRRCSGKCCG